MSGGKEWLDPSGCFRWGKHAGEEVEAVAKDDPGYLRWVMEQDDCDDGDREVMRAALRFRRY